MSQTQSPPPTVAPPPVWRWGALLVVSLAMAGNYYIYDAINPLETIFKEQLGFNATLFGWLNSSYSVAAVLTLLAGGYIVDRVGLKQSIAFFSALCFVGAALTASKGSFAVMVAGRTVLGLGAESLIVAVTTALAKWFKGKELSFAFGVNLTIARIASVAADRSPGWASWAFYPQGPAGPASWQRPMLIAVAAGGLCLIGAALYWLIEVAAQRRFTLGEAGQIDRLEVGRGLRFGTAYWCVVGLCFTFYSAIFPFRTFAIEFLTNKLLAAQGGALATESAKVLAHQQAGDFNSLLPSIAMFATPFFGLLVDKLGRRALLMTLGSLLLAPVYLLLAYSAVTPYVPLVMMGLAFSLIPAVMWPAVAYLVEQRRLGTGYALMTLIQQIGFFVFNLLIGWTNDHWGAGLANPLGYAPGMWIFSTLSVVGLTFAFLLRRVETRPGAHGLESASLR